MKRTAEEVANQKNLIIERREDRIRELEAENERLRKAAKEVVSQMFLSSDGRSLDHYAHEALLEAGEKLLDALDGGGDSDE